MVMLNKAFEVLLGSKDTIRYSHTAGRNAGFPVALLLVLYLTIFSESDLLERGLGQTPAETIIGFGEPIFCLFAAIVLIGGLAVGWLFVRPLASVLLVFLRDRDEAVIWGISSAVIWTTIALLITQPLDYLDNTISWIVYFAVILLTIVFAYFGGWRAVKNPIEHRKKFTSLALSGGVATGSLLGLMQTFTFSAYVDLGSFQISEVILRLLINLATFSFVCIIPFGFISIIPLIISVNERYKHYTVLATILLSAAIWFIISCALLSLSQDVDLVEYIIVPAIIVGLFGASGGYAIGQLATGKIYKRRTVL